MGLREIGSGGHHAEWVNGDVWGFANGRFNPPSGDYEGDCEDRESEPEQGTHVRSPLAFGEER